MATTTTNFGWDIPQSTDLVKDGATAIAALGQDIDTAFIDLKGGTTGQVLSKASNTDLDYTWVAQDDSNAIQNAIVDAKGDLIAATAADTPARLAVGTNGQVLTADSTAATGIKWATPASPTSGMTLINRTAFTSQATVNYDSVFSSTYKTYLVVIESVTASTGANDLLIFPRVGTTNITSGYYGNLLSMEYSTGTVTGSGVANAAQYMLNTNTANTVAEIYFSKVGQTTENPIWRGMSLSGDNLTATTFWGNAVASGTVTGFQIKSSSTNITGTVAVYGLAAA